VRLSQVFCNLLTNAAKYTGEGGHVEVTLQSTADDSQSAGEAVIRVRDTGRGIAHDELPRIFEPSTHEERLNSGEHGGLGIGLLVVRGLVQMHGGSVEARSEGPGLGSEFIVRLPLAAPEEFRMRVAPAQHVAPSAPITDVGGLRILVVDDNEDSACSMMLLLELQGHEVRAAHAGQTALAVAAEYRPEVILLDIGMPGMNGYEVARLLRAQDMFADTLLIAVTGYGRASDVKQTESAGFDYHLVKPIDYEKLHAHLAARGNRRGGGSSHTAGYADDTSVR
jgi:CheY-like chemotaxis protein